uniref:Uncharacterized protein n=1 Tax=Castor canadensis TaxID=51338 RepID=A0A8C0WLW6_CASCN
MTTTQKLIKNINQDAPLLMNGSRKCGAKNGETVSKAVLVKLKMHVNGDKYCHKVSSISSI